VRHAFLLGGLMLALGACAFGDLEGMFVADPDHPAIEYSSRPLKDAVSELNRKIQTGKVRLNFDEAQGYLRSVLEALSIRIESQIVVSRRPAFRCHGSTRIIRALFTTTTQSRSVGFTVARSWNWLRRTRSKA
jgi:hypothetical protein